MAFCFAIAAAPALGLLSDHVGTLGADRYSYVPDAIVFVPTLAAALAWGGRRARRPTRALVLVALVAANFLPVPRPARPVALQQIPLRRHVNRLGLLPTPSRSSTPPSRPPTPAPASTSSALVVVPAPNLLLNLARFETDLLAAATALRTAWAAEPTMSGLSQETDALLLELEDVYSALYVRAYLDLSRDARRPDDAGVLSDLGTLLNAEALFEQACAADPSHVQALTTTWPLSGPKKGALDAAIAPASHARTFAPPGDKRADELLDNIKRAAIGRRDSSK